MHIRLPFAAIAVLATVLPAAAQPAVEIGVVRGDDVFIRSGPGEDFYPTDRVAYGTRLEIYHRDPSGWLAVRPPRRSFSWVSSRHLEQTAANVGTIIAADVPAYIGSRETDKRDVVQVYLSRDEDVEVIGTRVFATREGAETWYMIAPPAGEFRWIAERNVNQTGELSYGDEPYLEDAALAELPPPAEARVVHTRVAAPDEPRRTTTSSATSTVASAGGWVPAPKGRRSRADETPATAPRTARSTAGATPASTDRVASITERLVELDLALADIVTTDPSNWNLEQLRRDADTLLLAATTTYDRGRVRQLTDRIDRLAEVGRRQRNLERQAAAPGNLPQTSSASLPTGDDLISATQRVSSLISGVGPGHDGQGQLARVQGSQPGAPNYALLDAQGNIAAFVTPAPGVPLHMYVGKRVGIDGSIGYLPAYDKQHLTAKRIQLLERTAWR